MFDPVKLFEDIATANDLIFIYGAKAHLNWEITQKDLTAGDLVMAMFPFEEVASFNNGSVSAWSVSTVLWIGAKFDPALTTYSNLDETEKQKYDRRLKTFSAMIETILSDLCASVVEVTATRRFREINKFDENTDVMGCELTFTYDPMQENAVPPAPLLNACSDIADTSFIVNWKQNGALGYYLDIATDAAFTSMVTGFNNLDLQNVSYKLASGLNSETKYYIRMRAYNSIGTSGNSLTVTATTLELGT
jgi:hypothetical protein